MFDNVRGCCSATFVGAFGNYRGWFRSRSLVFSAIFVGVFGNFRGCFLGFSCVLSALCVGVFGNVCGCFNLLSWVFSVTFVGTTAGSVAFKTLLSKCHPVCPWIRDLPQEEVPTCNYQPVTFVGVFGHVLGCFQSRSFVFSATFVGVFGNFRW